MTSSDAVTTALRAHLRVCPIAAGNRGVARRLRTVADALAQIGGFFPALRSIPGAYDAIDEAVLSHALLSHLCVCGVLPAMDPPRLATTVASTALNVATEALREAMPLIASAYARFAKVVVAGDAMDIERTATTWGILHERSRANGLDAKQPWWWESPDDISDDLHEEDAFYIRGMLMAMHHAVERRRASAHTTDHRTNLVTKGPAMSASPKPRTAAPKPCGLNPIRTAMAAMRADGLVLPDDVLVPLVRRALSPCGSIVLVWGRTGCGKTHTAEMLARHTRRTLVSADASRLVANGFKGETVSQLVARVAATQKSSTKNVLIVLDEIDKLSDDRSAHGDMLWTAQVRGQLLTLLGGGSVSAEDADHRSVVADMSSVMILMAGSFASFSDDGAYGIASASAPPSMGFAIGAAAPERGDASDDDHARLLKLGGLFIPEVVGRISCVLRLPDLSRDALIAIAHRHRHDATIAAASLDIGEDLLNTCPSAEALADDATQRGLGARWIATRLAVWQDQVAARAIAMDAVAMPIGADDAYAPSMVCDEAEECSDDASEYFPAELGDDWADDEDRIERLVSEEAA